MKSRDERDLFVAIPPWRSGFAAARSGQGRAVFQARRERTLDGEDRGESIVSGGKGRALDGAKLPTPAEEANDE